MSQFKEAQDRVVGDALRSLSTPPDDPEFWTRLRPYEDTQWDRSRLRRFSPARVAAVTACGSLLLGAGAGVAIAEATDLRSPTDSERATPIRADGASEASVLAFEPADGWSTVAATVMFPKNEQQFAWTTNGQPAAEESTSATPVATVRSMGADGIVVWCVMGEDGAGLDEFPIRDAPLQLAWGEFHSDGYEMQPAPNVATYGPISATVNGHPVSVFAWFGRNSPSEEQLAAAQAALDRLLIPPPSDPGS